MKLKSTLAGLLLLTSFSSFARGNDDLAIAPGTFTVYAGTAFPSYLRAIGGFEGGDVKPPLQLGFQYQVFDNFNVGLQCSYSKASSAWEEFPASNGNVFKLKYDISMITGLVNADYNWHNRNNIVLFSGLGIGYVSVSAKATFSDTANHSDQIPFTIVASGFAYQVRLFGVKARIARGLGAYADVGFGWHGLVAFGINYSIGGNNESYR